MRLGRTTSSSFQKVKTESERHFEQSSQDKLFPHTVQTAYYSANPTARRARGLPACNGNQIPQTNPYTS